MIGGSSAAAVADARRCCGIRGSAIATLAAARRRADARREMRQKLRPRPRRRMRECRRGGRRSASDARGRRGQVIVQDNDVWSSHSG
jgi:hypothetical protein